VELGRFATRFVTVVARLTATGATRCDEPIRLSTDFQLFYLYSAGTGATPWDCGTPLRITSLGFESLRARKSAGHRLAEPRWIFGPAKFGTQVGTDLTVSADSYPTGSPIPARFIYRTVPCTA
jgi:hypothetical protein